MALNFSAFSGPTGDREELPESGAARQLVNAKATPAVDGENPPVIRPLGAEASGGLAETGYPRPLPAPERGSNIYAQRCNFDGKGAVRGGDAIRSSCRWPGI
jgi:hypothetical protein